MRVRKSEFGSYITQNYDSIVQAIEDATGSHQFILDGTGATVKNGGFKIINQNGTTVMWINSSGVVMLHDLYFDNAAFARGSNFSSSLANMESITLQELKISGQIVVDEHDFYLYKNGEGGYNLKEYVNAILSDHNLI